MSRKHTLVLGLLVLGSLLLVGFSGPRQDASQNFGITFEWWMALLLIVVLVVFLAWWALRRPYRPGLPTAGSRPTTVAEAAEAVETAEGAVEAAGATVKAELKPEAPPVPDDLKRIEGIGPKIASVLQEAGIATFAQLAATSPDQIEQIIRAAGIRLGDPTTWPQQARLAAAGDWAGLEKLQDSLKGGRLVE